MNQFEEKLKLFIKDNDIVAEHMIFTESCHSVADAAKSSNSVQEDFVKNICLVDQEDRLVVGIVKGEHRVSTSRVAKLLGIESIRSATAEEIEKMTGYICGGVPSFGYEAIFLIDEKVLEREWIITGGGTENSLTKIDTKELLNANGGRVVRIRK